MALTSSLEVNATLPTLYEYYTAGGIQSGLNADKSYFTLNEKNITLYSGAMHYFRTPKQLWRDRLRKMRAAGLNAVETYVPWNLHEPSPGQFDFGHGGSDMEDFLDIETFLKTAQEEDLFTILRPGPYICAEWEFGGFPSWLLREKDIKFRTSDSKYMGPVKRFFNALLPILAALQFTNGGSIVMFQVENEYGSTASNTFSPDKEYLRQLRQLYLDNNITTLLVTADGVTAYGDQGSLNDLFLITANFDSNPTNNFNTLESLQPGRPKMAMEYYPGWFDHWGETHHTTTVANLVNNLEGIILYPGSFNIYMFHGGTDFGLVNGANVANDKSDNSNYEPDITSYDYDAPLTESGDYTEKYESIKLLLENSTLLKTKLPDAPELVARVAYEDIEIVDHISLKSLIVFLHPLINEIGLALKRDYLLSKVPSQGISGNERANKLAKKSFNGLHDHIDVQPIKIEYEKPTAMELIDINNGTGQSFGYINYRKENLQLTANSTLTISGHVCDSVLVLVNGKQISPPLKTVNDLNNFGFYRLENSQIVLTDVDLVNATLDLVVENWGRVNYGSLSQYYQFKGLWQGDLLINNEIITNWQHIPLEFKKAWNLNLQGWKTVQNTNEPGLYRGYINLQDSPRDTYIDMRSWTKGIVIVNGFVLGRYARIGPQQCLYLPAPLLRQGQNEFVVFEHFEAFNNVVFTTDQIWETLN